jgi:hypothetical protein
MDVRGCLVASGVRRRVLQHVRCGLFGSPGLECMWRVFLVVAHARTLRTTPQQRRLSTAGLVNVGRGGEEGGLPRWILLRHASPLHDRRWWHRGVPDPRGACSQREPALGGPRRSDRRWCRSLDAGRKTELDAAASLVLSSHERGVTGERNRQHDSHSEGVALHQMRFAPQQSRAARRHLSTLRSPGSRAEGGTAAAGPLTGLHGAPPSEQNGAASANPRGP